MQPTSRCGYRYGAPRHTFVSAAPASDDGAHPLPPTTSGGKLPNCPSRVLFLHQVSRGAEHLDGLKDFIEEIHLGLDQPIRLLGHAPLRITTGEPG